MTNKALQWTAIEVNRRGFLRRVTGLSFALFGGLAALKPQLAWAVTCTGPNGSGWCGSSYCSGSVCQSSISGATCSYAPGWCVGDHIPCWTVGSQRSCDCRCCTYYGTCWYCCCKG